MNKWHYLLIGILFILILIICSTDPAVSDLFTAKKQPSPQMDQSASAKVSVSQNNIREAIGEHQTPSQSHISVNFEPSASDYPLLVTKRVLEPSKDGYFVDKPIQILVKVDCIAGKGLDEVFIYEHTDDDLDIISAKKFLRSSRVNDTLNPNRKFNDNYSYDAENNLIYLPIRDMYSRESVIYKYCVKPSKPGVYDSYTFIRIPSNDSKYPDNLITLEIEAKEDQPEFQVKLDTGKAEWDCEASVPLRYIIKYLGGSATNPCKYNISLESVVGDFSGKKDFDAIEFNINKSTEINSSIEYLEEGKYWPPTVMIGGQVYTFEGTIQVRKWWRKYIEDQGLFLVTLALVFATIGLILAEGTSEWKDKLKILGPLLLLYIIIYILIKYYD